MNSDSNSQNLIQINGQFKFQIFFLLWLDSDSLWPLLQFRRDKTRQMTTTTSPPNSTIDALWSLPRCRSFVIRSTSSYFLFVHRLRHRCPGLAPPRCSNLEMKDSRLRRWHTAVSTSSRPPKKYHRQRQDQSHWKRQTWQLTNARLKKDGRMTHIGDE